MSIFKTQILFIYYFYSFGHTGTFVLQPGLNPLPPALKGGILITGPPGKSPNNYFFFSF